MDRLGRVTLLMAASMMLGQAAQAQTQTQQQQYAEFKKKAQGDYKDFRRKANEEYAKFLKKAWSSYEAKAPRPKPVEKDVKPVVLDEKKPTKPIKDREIKVEEAKPQPQPDPQPQPLEVVVPVEMSKIPVVKPFTVPKVTVPVKLKNMPAVVPAVKDKEEENKEIAEEKPTTPEVKPTAPDVKPVVVAPITPVVPSVVPTIPAVQPVVIVDTPVVPAYVDDTPLDDSYVVFETFGTECRVRFSLRDFSFGNTLTNDAVSNAWLTFTNSDIDNTLYDCLEIRKELQLSDWAYYLMLKSFARKCFGDSNEAVFLQAYLYCQSGYKMRLGRAGDKLRLLVGSRHVVYGKSFHFINGEDFYALDSKDPKLMICEVGFPKEQAMSFYITQEQLYADNDTPMREIKSKRYSDMAFSVNVNKNLLDFYETYPASVMVENSLTTWEMYARTPLESRVKAQLYPEMMQRLEGKTQLEAVNRLLNWVQTGFVYEYDEKVWGTDRAFFAEETLYYPYCDCEDRSILLSHLVRDLVGLDVLLVYYPGHLASAVAFTEDVKGDYISYNGRKFVVCDGTYIGASVGMTMPGMDNQKAKVILLEAEK